MKLSRLLCFVLIMTLSACTASITQKAFIAQHETVTDYSPEQLEQWRQWLPELEVKSLSMTAQDGVSLRGIYLDNPHSQDLVLYFTGNGMAISKAPEWWLQSLSASGKDVVLFDRRGLGASSGEATIQRLRQDSQDKYDFVQQGFQPKQIIVHGFSLGSFIGADLARHRPVDKLVLEGSATDVHDWIDEVTPWYMKAFLSFEIEPAFSEVSNIEAVKGYIGPLLLIAAENDKQVPSVLSQKLLEVSQSKDKTLLVVKGADHGSMLKDPSTVAAYVEFLNQP